MNAIRLTNEQAAMLKGIRIMVDAQLIYYKWVGENGFESMKDISCAILDLADATGYDYDFLVDRIEEQVADGEEYEDAFMHVAGVSFEQDW